MIKVNHIVNLRGLNPHWTLLQSRLLRVRQARFVIQRRITQVKARREVERRAVSLNSEITILQMKAEQETGACAKPVAKPESQESPEKRVYISIQETPLVFR